LYLALQREVPSAAEVFKKVQTLKTILIQVSSVPSESSSQAIAQVQKEVGRMMVYTMGAEINDSEFVLQALGESLLANDVQRLKPDSSFNQRLYANNLSNDVDTIASYESLRLRHLCRVFEGNSLSNRAVAALLLSFDDMSSPFFRSILPSSARLLNAYDLAVELGSLTFLRSHSKNLCKDL
jgi:hypothetical protein